tara:strand:+ start:211980 stop:212348 length:369 start_codon:yes stop_codon:yes gene_type:complete
VSTLHFGDDKKLIHRTQEEFKESFSHTQKNKHELQTRTDKDGYYYAYNTQTGFTVKRDGVTGQTVDMDEEQLEAFNTPLSEEELKTRREEYVTYLREQQKDRLQKDFSEENLSLDAEIDLNI